MVFSAMNLFTFCSPYPLVPHLPASLVEHPGQPRKRGCFILLLIDKGFVTVTDPFLLRLT
jgi:hypothetical protein